MSATRSFNRIDPGQSSADRQRSLSDLLRTLACVHDTNTNPETRDTAVVKLDRVYRSGEQRNLGLASGTTGGFLIPTGSADRVLAAIEEESLVRPRATVIPMPTGMEMPVPMFSPTSTPVNCVQTYSTGGFVPQFGQESYVDNRDVTFAQAKLSVCELTGSFGVSASLLKSTPVVFDLMAEKLLAKAVSDVEDYAFLRGKGGKEPLGVLNSEAVITTADRGSATVITTANARAVLTRIPSGCRSRMIWIYSQNAENAVLGMSSEANSTTQNTSDVPAGEGFAMGLFHRPLVVSEKLPALNSMGDFGGYDFSYYLVGDAGTEIANSVGFDFQRNLVWFRVVRYVAGMPWVTSPLLLSDGSTTASPFVLLGPH
jgi:HK97 family phage major capsid protein